METKIEMKGPIDTISSNDTSVGRLKKLPQLRGGGSCREHCSTIICILICMTIGFTIFAAAGGVYISNNSNVVALNVTIAGTVILAFSILICVGFICKICADSTDRHCGCHLCCCD
ncbi:unnamed protein product [Adineta ricciae]|uniref:Uncharacterized protein n=1 Tax=Adineta ricciae TaxID=249248 RepID=A0A816FKQ7_ADIRI|nr:unnamed protein product [Adineta ricciae]CAF1662927.1 unnamed protein product [Adineta ricciae]